MPRRDRVRAKRRRARNLLLAATALILATYLLVESFSGLFVVVWLVVLGVCVSVFRAPRAPGAGP